MTLAVALLVASTLTPFQTKSPAKAPATPATQELPFAKEIQAFKNADTKIPPAKGQILFVGSSSFTRWTDVATYFPNHKILNRGFGGSSLPDVIRYADEVIFKYAPKQVVVYCGENDVAGDAKIASYVVANRFKTLYSMIQRRMPGCPVAFVSLKPCWSRWHLRSKMIATNRMIADFATSEKHLTFIDVYNPMLDGNGRPKDGIYIQDALHMNAKGYQIWAPIIEPYLVK